MIEVDELLELRRLCTYNSMSRRMGLSRSADDASHPNQFELRHEPLLPINGFSQARRIQANRLDAFLPGILQTGPYEFSTQAAATVIFANDHHRQPRNGAERATKCRPDNFTVSLCDKTAARFQQQHPLPVGSDLIPAD